MKNNIGIIANCPLCGSEATLMKYSSDPEGTKYVSCSNEDCEMWIVPMILPDLWNRLRIAPDDKDVAIHAQKVSYFHLNPIPKDRVFFKKWMNPNYPKEASND